MRADVARRIARRIDERGPITFAEFMDEALYGPGGFYERPPVGADGHFVTSPHVHPLFARLVGVGLEQLWNEIGRPAPLRLVEVGAGDGTMARELVAGFARGGIELEYTAVEISAGAREALAETGVAVAERVGDLPRLDPGLVLANELLDNLPFRRVRAGPDGPLEVRVGLVDGRLAEVQVPYDDAIVVPLPHVEGAEVIVPTGALAFVDDLAASLAGGYALVVDYAAEPEANGAPHGYRDHREVDALLEEPGAADITAGVDLGAVTGHAAALGLTAFRPVEQWRALVALGYEEWTHDELARQRGLLGSDRGTDAVRAWVGRSRASLLVEPAGLGGLRWLVLATPGLAEPPWLARARKLQPRAR